jgi:ribonuclease HII
MTADNFQFERKCISNGKIVAGIDEVGRGPLAGPVVAAVVLISDKSQYIQGVKDSKKLSTKKLLEYDKLIRDRCLEFAIGSCSVEEIDQMGIGNAVARAMERAYMELKNKPDEIIVDGASITKPNLNCTMIRNGDDIHYSISCASIIAKVYRDNIMHKLARKYPRYGWDHNVGYGTLEHRNAIEKYGFTDLHRKSFSPVKDMI